MKNNAQIKQIKQIKHSNKNRSFVKSNIWWWSQKNNFGDWIGPWLASKMHNTQMLTKPMHSTKVKASVYSVGSIISQVHENGIVWGSGIIQESCKPQNRNIKICSTRGPLTRQKLIQQGFNCPEIYGDPAMILPKFIFKKENTKMFELGIIPHYVDYKIIKNHSISKDPRVLIINLETRDVEKIVKQILQCKNIVSSSLHGVIVGIAYQIPTRWVMFGNKLFGNQIKFFDFFLSLEEKSNHKVMLPQVKKIIQHHTQQKKWHLCDSKNINKAMLPIDFRNEKMKNLTFDKLVASTHKFAITESLTKDIEKSCPFLKNSQLFLSC